MDKISGILPSSPRITAVDLKSSGASRPGMPTFGRTVGSSVLAEPDRLALSSTPTDYVLESEFGQRRELSPREQKANIVKTVSDGFFMKKARQYRDSSTPKIDIMPEGVLDVGSSRVDTLSGDGPPSRIEKVAQDFSQRLDELVGPYREPDVFDTSESLDDLDRPEVGGYLDVVV